MSLFDSIQFRTFDYDGFRQSLFQLAKSRFTQWTDTLESNEGVMFVEWLAFIGANICYMQNFHARQAFVPTVTEPNNLIKLAKQFDYSIPNNVSSVVDVTISNQGGGVFTSTVVVPALTQLRTSGAEPVIFETTAPLTIPANAASGIVSARHQETKVENDTADGAADFQTAMTYGPYIEDSMSVEVGGDPAWVLVDNFLDSSGASKHFRVEVNSDQIPSVIFGDGINGIIPGVNEDIEYTYRVGGGTAGNVSPGTIIQIPGTFYDVNNNPVDLVVTNVNAAEGGQDREEVEVTKVRMPKSLSSRKITINYEDFQTNIQSVPGVARVGVLTVNDNVGIPENTVLCVVLPTVGDTMSGALRAEIEGVFVENPRPLTQRLILVDPNFITIPIQIKDLVVEQAMDDDSGTFANATVTIANNSFSAGDKVIVNGVGFEQGVDWAPGGSIALSASALALAIENSLNPLLQDITASAVGPLITISSRTKGVQGNSYTLSEVDTGTNNFTLSGATFQNGTDTTTQAKIRAAVDAFFGRTNIGEDGEYTVEFGQPVYLNKLIWLIQDVVGVESFILESPVADTPLEFNTFPKYTLKFTTSS
jgi:hypothetical protein